MGLLMMRGWNSKVWNWVEIGPARGDIVVPPRMELMLVANREATTRLSALGQIEPESIQAMHLRQTAIGDNDLDELQRLTTLKTLDLRDTRITDAGLPALKQMANLKTVYLPTQITEAGLRSLKRRLPECIIRRHDGRVVTIESPSGGRALHPNGSTRLLRFPADRSLGLLQFRPTGSKEWKWNDLGPAQGELTIQKDKELLLIMNRGALIYLELLADLDPNDLDSLHLGRSPCQNDQIACLSHLTGLKTLELRGTQITDTGLVHLRKLTSLRSLCLPETVSEEGIKELRQYLPQCKIS